MFGSSRGGAEGFGEKDGGSGRNRGLRWFIFLHNTKPPDLGELKKCIGGRFWRGFRGLR